MFDYVQVEWSVGYECFPLGALSKLAINPETCYNQMAPGY